MSALEAEDAFDITFPSPVTPPSEDEFPADTVYTFDPSLLDLRYNSCHVSSPSPRCTSVSSSGSSAKPTQASSSNRLPTPPLRSSPPVRHHGPVLLPKIRPQDQHIDDCRADHRDAALTMNGSQPRNTNPSTACRSDRERSSIAPETLSGMAYAHLSSFPSGGPLVEASPVTNPAPLLTAPVDFSAMYCHNGYGTQTTATELDMPLTSRQETSRIDLGAGLLGPFTYPAYRQSPVTLLSTRHAMSTPPPDFPFPSVYVSARSQSPSGLYTSPDRFALTSACSTTLDDYLTRSNPAASLVRTISFPARSPNTKHFWWDIRNVRSWASFNSQAIRCLPGASTLLSTPVSACNLPQPSMSNRHPETEASLHDIYASYYLPKLNSALATSPNGLQFSVPAKSAHTINDLLIVADDTGGSSDAATIFGGKPSARIVGLVRSFDRFNTGMRVEGNIKRVEYLRGLATLHYAMRERSCRYGFILTEIELVLVRCGTESIPYFGDVEVTSVHLSASSAEDAGSACGTPLTACLALWGLCRIAGDDTPLGHAHWKAEIGAPAEGTRRKAKPRDSWMPQPQLAEKREAKRSRGWVWPEDVIGRKELGKRGVKYGGA